MNIKKIITIDGPSGAGKSSVSRLLAKKLGLVYLDTGAMYRAVALKVQRTGTDIKDGNVLKRLCANIDLAFDSDGDNPKIYMEGEDISAEIRSPEMDMLSSTVSAVKEVREAMTGLQRRIGNAAGLVAEGRDMGTVVFPDSPHKFFITASPSIRAERRYNERIARGENITREYVKNELIKRDEQDSKRLIAPLQPAKDAIIIDTSNLDIDQVINEIIKNIADN